jgi:signal transduction histidine kinase
MLFLFGASFYFLAGIADLQQKRLRIRALESEEKAQIDQLRRLTDELAAANRRIQESDRLKSQFLANMSHELRTPLNSIIGFSEILVDRLESRVETKHYGFLKHIHASGQHLLGIINDILDLSKIEAGKMEIFPEYFSIAPVIESVCHMIRGMTKSYPRFVVDVPNDLPLIETDLAKFKQVLFNLVSNSIKFSPADSTITISARFIGATQEEGSINVSVADEGIGIDPQHHEMIFEEFRQIDATVRREFGGTGLGLALVKRFVELQGGRVSLESSPGRGSTFSFRLPVRSRAAVVSRIASSSSRTIRTPTTSSPRRSVPPATPRRAPGTARRRSSSPAIYGRWRSRSISFCPASTAGKCSSASRPTARPATSPSSSSRSSRTATSASPSAPMTIS